MTSNDSAFGWTDDMIARLRQFWAEGHATAEIGRRLGVSKNAVVGKAHRLNLEGRPSPIRQDSARKPRAPARPRPPRLADVIPLASCKPDRPDRCTGDHSPPAAVRPTPAVRRTAASVVGNKPCCWPIGEPGTRSFRFCDALALTGKPYCEEHSELAYVRQSRSGVAQAGGSTGRVASATDG